MPVLSSRFGGDVMHCWMPCPGAFAAAGHRGAGRVLDGARVLVPASRRAGLGPGDVGVHWPASGSAGSTTACGARTSSLAITALRWSLLIAPLLSACRYLARWSPCGVHGSPTPPPPPPPHTGP